MVRYREKFERKINFLKPYEGWDLYFFCGEVDNSADRRFAHKIGHGLRGGTRRRDYSDIDAIVRDYILERTYVIYLMAVVDHADLMLIVIEDRDDLKAILGKAFEVQKRGPQISHADYCGFICLIEAENFHEDLFQVEYVVSLAFLAEFAEKGKVFAHLRRFYVKRFAYSFRGNIERAAAVYRI